MVVVIVIVNAAVCVMMTDMMVAAAVVCRWFLTVTCSCSTDYLTVAFVVRCKRNASCAPCIENRSTLQCKTRCYA